ncbi:MAG: hypothetical protein Q8L06_06940 [Pseudohongiella sp.]|nr:hypothetical protein [Pseudohongiella sp.]
MSMNFQYKWLGKRKLPHSLSPEERHTRCELSLLVNDHHYLRNEDLLNKHRVNNFVYVAAYPLAEFFAVNWWRLLCEAPKSDNIRSQHIDWLMSHKVGATAAGYYWPDLTIYTDGESVQLHLESGKEAKGPLRYLDTRSDWIAISEYESAISDFVSNIIARLDDKKVSNTDLKALWAELTLERSCPEITTRRRLEAIMGFDPDEAPQDVIAELVGAGSVYGSSSIEELTQALGMKVPEYLVALSGKLETHFSLPQTGSDEIKSIKGTPWERGYALADKLRKSWAIPKGNIENAMLADIIGVPVNKIECNEDAQLEGIGIGKRLDTDVVAFNLGKSRNESRRFMLARLICDALVTDSAERLLPCTDLKTSRQKLQRAFAQEFLCPYQDLVEHLNTETPNDDQQIIAAEHFQVSPMMISRIFQNHRHSGSPTGDGGSAPPPSR